MLGLKLNHVSKRGHSLLRDMVMPGHGNSFRSTYPLWGDTTGPPQKASNVGFDVRFKKVDLTVIWDAMVLILTSL